MNYELKIVALDLADKGFRQFLILVLIFNFYCFVKIISHYAGTGKKK